MIETNKMGMKIRDRIHSEMNYTQCPIREFLLYFFYSVIHNIFPNRQHVLKHKRYKELIFNLPSYYMKIHVHVVPVSEIACDQILKTDIEM